MTPAITFDLWDTLLADDSDEPVRAARGLPPKATARRDAFVTSVTRHSTVDRATAAAAWNQAWTWFEHQWKVDHLTPTVAERVDVALTTLGQPRPADFDALVSWLETMERQPGPDLVEGCAPAIHQLSQHYSLGIISDTTTTPGRVLREILADHGLLSCFSHCVFSDEVRHAKPSIAVFEHAAAGLGVTPRHLVHIGDREAHDIDGARAAGARSILFTAAVDRGSAHTRADAVCDRFDALPALLAELTR